MSLRAQQLNSRRFQIPISSGSFSINGSYSDGSPIVSNKNTHGYISSTVTHPTVVYNPGCNDENKCPRNIVKYISSIYNYLGYDEYLKDKSQKTLECDISSIKTIVCDPSCNRKTNYYYIGGQKFYAQTKINKIITPTNSDFIENKHKKTIICNSGNAIVVTPPKLGGPCSGGKVLTIRSSPCI